MKKKVFSNSQMEARDEAVPPQHRDALERRQPAAEEQQRGQHRDQDHVGVFGEEEDREGHARVLDVEAGDDLRLALGDVEGRAVGLGDAGDEVDAEQRQQRQPEPVSGSCRTAPRRWRSGSGCRRPPARRPARSPWRSRRRRSAPPSASRRASAYLELDAQPAMMTP
jgi:hypothetical protein